MAASSRELAAVDQLIAAKDAYRDDPSKVNQQTKTAAVAEVRRIRIEERNGRATSIGGDAYINNGA